MKERALDGWPLGSAAAAAGGDGTWAGRLSLLFLLGQVALLEACSFKHGAGAGDHATRSYWISATQCRCCWLAAALAGRWTWHLVVMSRPSVETAAAAHQSYDRCMLRPCIPRHLRLARRHRVHKPRREERVTCRHRWPPALAAGWRCAPASPTPQTCGYGGLCPQEIQTVRGFQPGGRFHPSRV